MEDQVRAATTEPDSAWASQPGALRTFHAGELSQIYKLYSAPELIAVSAAEAEADLAPDWDSQPDHFVDLNAPSLGDGGALSFPIADPRADAEGFAYEAAINGVFPPTAADPRLPMPVRWLYLLADGSCGSLDAENCFVGPIVPTTENPIVGRIAFWADDLSSKINVNTASEGSYWDMPRFDSPEERGFARSQPASGEYQRHPGHPATVCLSSVLFPGKAIGAGLTESETDLLWRIGNGIGTGGSQNGTIENQDISPVSPEPADYFPYSDIGHVARPGVAGDDVDPELVQRLDRADFFLTTYSRSPDTTAGGFPRMSMWPIPFGFLPPATVVAYRDVQRLGSQRYSFGRNNANSAHNEVYSPALPYNLPFIDYVDRLANAESHHFGGSLADKFGTGPISDTRQIVAGAYSHIRSTNLNDRNARSPFSSGGETNITCLCGGTGIHNAVWDDPSPESAYAFSAGRDYTISEVALGFISGPAVDTPQGVQRSIGVTLLIEAFCPSHGYHLITPNHQIKVTGGGGMELNGSPLHLTSTGFSVTFDVSATNPRPGGLGGLEFAHSGGDSISPANISTVQPAPTMTLTGGEPIRIVIGEPGGANPPNGVQQVFEILFPSMQLPIPRPTIVQSWAQRFFSTSGSLILDGDVVRSMVIGHGDYRLTASTRTVPVGAFQPHPLSMQGGSVFMAHSLVGRDGEKLLGFSSERPLIPEVSYPSHLLPDMPLSPSNQSYAPLLPPGYSYPTDPAITGDFDNGFGHTPDGPYINRADDGAIQANVADTPYFDLDAPLLQTTDFHAPQRMVPSPVALGSIPSGVRAGVPWRTLLFRPDRLHFGASGTPDHHWLDLFRMPTPFPLKRPRIASSVPAEYQCDAVSANGKINMNYAMLPFHHIERSTALRAAMKAERVIAIPTDAGAIYKSQTNDDKPWRHRIDADETLLGWQHRFANGEIFRSASEICEMYLVPDGEELGSRSESGVYPEMRAFWDAHKLTGDNSKERPYAGLYQKLATRSDAFQIHAIVETISKAPGSPADQFDPAVDQTAGPQRFTEILHRELNTISGALPSYVTDAAAGGVESYYTYHLQGVPDDLDIEPEYTFGESEVSVSFSATEGAFELQRSTDLERWQPIAQARPRFNTVDLSDHAPLSGDAFYRIARANIID